MTIEQDFFAKKRPDFHKLTQYGFKHENNHYHLQRKFSHNDFSFTLDITPPNSIKGRVIDNATNEEYLPLRATHCGSFASKVKKAYLDCLGEIADHCFITKPFYSDQANRLAEKIASKFGDQPDFVFKRFPDYAVFREPESRKWYALIMRIPRTRLADKNSSSSNPKIEVVDLRIDPVDRAKLLQKPGIYPGYHLNKQNWLTLTLDDTLPDKLIVRLLTASRASLISLSQ